VIRGQLLEHGSKFDDDNEAKKNRFLDSRKVNALLYDEEQEAIRNDFLKAVKSKETTDIHDDVEEEEEEDVIIVKKITKKEVEEEERLLKEALNEMQKLNSKQNEILSSNNVNTDELKKDEFLSNYLIKRRWLDPMDSHSADDENNEELAYSDDEAELERVDNFESKYNFRFEELQGEEEKEKGGERKASSSTSSKYIVMGHARAVEGSVRRSDESRKKQRESRKENKERERRQKEEELKRLKNLKRQEVKCMMMIVHL